MCRTQIARWTVLPAHSSFFHMRNTRYFKDGNTVIDTAPKYPSTAYSRISSRKARGWPEHMLHVGPRNTSKLHKSPWGMLSIQGLSDATGVSRGAMRKRLMRWPLEDALNTPAHGVRGRHFIMPPEEFRERMKKHGFETD